MARLNPRGQVPVLVDGDTVVCDSTVILEYLEDAYPQPPLMPHEPAGRAQVRKWEAWADEVLFPQVWELIEGSFYPAETGTESARFEAAKKEVAALHAVLDSQLAGREWIADRFSIADIGCFIILSSGATLGAPPAAEHANLLSWLARAGARPPIKTEMEAMLAFVASLADR